MGLIFLTSYVEVDFNEMRWITLASCVDLSVTQFRKIRPDVWENISLPCTADEVLRPQLALAVTPQDLLLTLQCDCTQPKSKQ
jgi:hypothetical protein